MELARRWLAAFGPGTSIDVQWWTGWSVGNVRGALEQVGAVEVGLETGTGYLLAEDLGPVDTPDPWVALLPGLDPTVMGWKQRDWYLGSHAGQLFDTNGNAGPTVWSDGRVVGGWAQRSDGEVAVRMFEDVGGEATGRIHEEVGRQTACMGGVRVRPRFPSPVEWELTRESAPLEAVSEGRRVRPSGRPG